MGSNLPATIPEKTMAPNVTLEANLHYPNIQEEVTVATVG